MSDYVSEVSGDSTSNTYWLISNSLFFVLFHIIVIPCSKLPRYGSFLFSNCDLFGGQHQNKLSQPLTFKKTTLLKFIFLPLKKITACLTITQLVTLLLTSYLPHWYWLLATKSHGNPHFTLFELDFGHAEIFNLKKGHALCNLWYSVRIFYKHKWIN